MSAVSPVFLFHQHGVTVSRHLFPLFPRSRLNDFEETPGGNFDLYTLQIRSVEEIYGNDSQEACQEGGMEEDKEINDLQGHILMETDENAPNLQNLADSFCYS
jgi:hypothetical protein